MKIRWLGHSCFLLTNEAGGTLITDPYDVEYYSGSLAYEPITESAGVVTVSHYHADHGNVGAVGGSPTLVDTVAGGEADGFRIRGVPAFHDTEAGDKRGDDTIFIISADGLNICHLGDLGHVISSETASLIGRVDVLLIPVGGTFTIDAAAASSVWQKLAPPITIPMHFRNKKCHFNIDGVDRFLAGKVDVEQPGASDVTITKENLPVSPKIIVLDPAH